ncbi:hypothetical protein HPG69_001570 [Diceros bicornis minor]|uniref:Transmembrane protein 33 n=1 Tax=Diceros bicornis minor TaxID=77932 RepID=A0A7J7FG97_DICBM|nr:hypothetical protein HPG69_001570 [Diceros bicornis minor]
MLEENYTSEKVRVLQVHSFQRFRGLRVGNEAHLRARDEKSLFASLADWRAEHAKPKQEKLHFPSCLRAQLPAPPICPRLVPTEVKRAVPGSAITWSRRPLVGVLGACSEAPPSLRSFWKPSFAVDRAGQRVLSWQSAARERARALRPVEARSRRRARRACGTGQGSRLPESWPPRRRRVCEFPMADTAPNGPQGAGAVSLNIGKETEHIFYIFFQKQFMMTNKLDTAMWISRLFTVYCSALFVLPLLGLHEAASFYQRALLANALTSALRLHQRLPHFQLSRAFLAQALLEDSCHYLLYSLIFVNSYPVTMSIFPVLLFSLLHAATYTKKVLDAKGSNSLPLLRSILDKLSSNQQNILKFIACNEIFLMPATVFMLFSGQGSLLQPFIYYRFLTLRYSSRRNPYCRTLFNELRIVVEHIIMKPACPLFVRRLCLQSIAFISRLAPTVA